MLERGRERAIGATERSDRALEDTFVSVVQENIIETMSEALEEVGFSSDEERSFRKYLVSLPLPDINGVLSLPYEVRRNRLARLHERVAKGASIPEVVDSLAQEARKRIFALGYHMSNADIIPQLGAHGESWTVDGREQDHRDNDLPMAYYSTDLANLYGKKKARFLYIVRAEMGPDTTHKQDNDGSWGRATKLDIVDRLNYEDVMREVRGRVENPDTAAEKAA